jgi:hypothetical protein
MVVVEAQRGDLFPAAAAAAAPGPEIDRALAHGLAGSRWDDPRRGTVAGPDDLAGNVLIEQVCPVAEHAAGFLPDRAGTQ